MKIKHLLALFLFISFAAAGSSNVHSSHDELEKRFISKPQVTDNIYQATLRSQAPWQQFSTLNPEWWVQFNENTATPHRAMGKPVQIPVTGSPEQAALYFLNNQASMFLPQDVDLKFAGSTENKQYYQPNFIQYFQGREILWSRATVKMTKDFRAVMFGTDLYSDIRLSSNPVIGEQAAVQSATIGVSNIKSINVNPELKILPVQRGHGNLFHLVYEVTVNTEGADGIPANYYTLLDAQSGTVLYRQNRVQHFANTDIVINGTIYPTHVYNPSQFTPLQYVKMNLGGLDYNANANGQYTSLVLANPVQATFSLEGPWAKVYTGSTGSTVQSFTTNITLGSNSVSFDNDASIRHLSAYYHTNVVHDFLNQMLPSYSGLDFPMIVKVDLTTGNCNAFYNGDLNFYTTAGGCNALSQVNDVVYHEYGHAITNTYWAANGMNFSNGAMGEGYSDVWAISITADPVLGIGFDDTDPTVFIRTYDFNNGVSRKIYPQNIVGEVHADGEIIAGAWYSTALSLGLSTMSSLFAESHSGLANGPDGAEGQVYTDILIDALLSDDNDADITNGTPNGVAITSAFAAHGITLLSSATLTHTPVATTQSFTPIVLNASIATTPFFWAFSAIKGAYQVNNTGPWTPFTMTSTGGNNYTTTIPGYPAGTIIGYYLGVEDTYNNFSNVQPVAANATVNPNIPYYTMVGFTWLFTDDFDQNAGFWITGLPGDNATTGMWEQNEPIATTQGAMMVQPGYQTTPGGQFCYVTDADPGTGLGAFDVDGGKTSMQSPDIDMSAMDNPAIEYYRWYTNDQGATPGTDFWQVYISNDGVNYVPVENTPTADHSWRRFAFRVKDYITLSSTVSVRFVAEDANDGSLIEALMDDFSVYEAITSGLHEQSSILTASLAPNPANDFLLLNCALAQTENFTLTISDAVGKSVYTEKVNFVAGSNQFSLPVRQLANGMYHVNLSNEKGRKTLRFVIAR